MIIRKSSALGAALALVFATTMAGTASAADSLRIQVGDVSTPAGAHALEQRINRAAARLCAPSYALVDLNGWHFCLKSVREEALAQLSPADQQAYNAALHEPVALATR